MTSWFHKMSGDQQERYKEKHQRSKYHHVPSVRSAEFRLAATEPAAPDVGTVTGTPSGTVAVISKEPQGVKVVHNGRTVFIPGADLDPKYDWLSKTTRWKFKPRWRYEVTFDADGRTIKMETVARSDAQALNNVVSRFVAGHGLPPFKAGAYVRQAKPNALFVKNMVNDPFRN